MSNNPSSPIYYHGTKANFQKGDLIESGFKSNYGSQRIAKYVYLTETLEAATWGAELAQGEGKGRIYIVNQLAISKMIQIWLTKNSQVIQPNRTVRQVHCAL